MLEAITVAYNMINIWYNKIKTSSL